MLSELRRWTRAGRGGRGRAGRAAEHAIVPVASQKKNKRGLQCGVVVV